MAKHILLAEDDQDFRNILKQYLLMFDYTVTCARDGEEAISLFTKGAFDICILDVMMPKLDGFSVAEKIIDLNPETPFIFLTARKMKEDKIRGLKLGADDYIVKPFEADELVLRLKNILKRNKSQPDVVDNSVEIKIGKYVFDSARLELIYENKVQRLTKKETSLIQFLFLNMNKVVRREDVLRAVWGNEDFFSGRSMDVFISRLRKYFNKDSTISIKSIRGVGLEFQTSSSS